jgi:hypothetical protein
MAINAKTRRKNADMYLIVQSETAWSKNPKLPVGFIGVSVDVNGVVTDARIASGTSASHWDEAQSIMGGGGGGGLTTVTHDTSLTGAGTVANPLGIAQSVFDDINDKIDAGELEAAINAALENYYDKTDINAMIQNIQLPEHYEGVCKESELPEDSANKGDYWIISDFDVTAEGVQGEAIWDGEGWTYLEFNSTYHLTPQDLINIVDNNYSDISMYLAPSGKVMLDLNSEGYESIANSVAIEEKLDDVLDEANEYTNNAIAGIPAPDLSDYDKKADAIIREATVLTNAKDYADTKQAKLTSGSNITITTDNVISSTDTNTTYTAGNGLQLADNDEFATAFEINEYAKTDDLPVKNIVAGTPNVTVTHNDNTKVYTIAVSQSETTVNWGDIKGDVDEQGDLVEYIADQIPDMDGYVPVGKAGGGHQGEIINSETITSIKSKNGEGQANFIMDNTEGRDLEQPQIDMFVTDSIADEYASLHVDQEKVVLSYEDAVRETSGIKLTDADIKLEVVADPETDDQDAFIEVESQAVSLNVGKDLGEDQYNMWVGSSVEVLPEGSRLISNVGDNPNAQYHAQVRTELYEPEGGDELGRVVLASNRYSMYQNFGTEMTLEQGGMSLHSIDEGLGRGDNFGLEFEYEFDEDDGALIGSNATLWANGSNGGGHNPNPASLKITGGKAYYTKLNDEPTDDDEIATLGDIGGGGDYVKERVSKETDYSNIYNDGDSIELAISTDSQYQHTRLLLTEDDIEFSTHDEDDANEAGMRLLGGKMYYSPAGEAYNEIDATKEVARMKDIPSTSSFVNKYSPDTFASIVNNDAVGARLSYDNPDKDGELSYFAVGDQHVRSEVKGNNGEDNHDAFVDVAENNVTIGVHQYNDVSDIELVGYNRIEIDDDSISITQGDESTDGDKPYNSIYMTQGANFGMGLTGDNGIDIAIGHGGDAWPDATINIGEGSFHSSDITDWDGLKYTKGNVDSNGSTTYPGLLTVNFSTESSGSTIGSINSGGMTMTTKGSTGYSSEIHSGGSVIDNHAIYTTGTSGQVGYQKRTTGTSINENNAILQSQRQSYNGSEYVYDNSTALMVGQNAWTGAYLVKNKDFSNYTPLATEAIAVESGASLIKALQNATPAELTQIKTLLGI